MRWWRDAEGGARFVEGELAACVGKRVYGSWSEANRGLRFAKKRKVRRKTRIYRCKFCGGWHRASCLD